MRNDPESPVEQQTPPAWSFRFVLGQRLVTVAIPPHLILTLLLIALAGYGLGGHHAKAEQRRQNEMVTILKQRNEQLQRSLSQREIERDQLVALAEAQSEELWGEMEDQDRELRRLWNQIGQPEHQAKAGRLALSSRGGDRADRALAALQARPDNTLAPLQERFKTLKASSQTRGQEVLALSKATRAYLAQLTPTLVPCKGEMSSGFGYRLHPLYGYNKLHSGCDFTTDHGTPIQATADGKVVRSDWYGGYGKTVEIEHGFGLKTLYAHCDELKVKKGQRVKKGQQIATVGTTGLSSGPHCHYEVHKRGKPVNPRRYLPK